MRTLVRWIVGLVVIVHGVVHLLGAFVGLGWAEVPELTGGDRGQSGAPAASRCGLCASGRRRRGPRIIGFHAEISGRIRGGATDPWMPWTGEQTNTFGSEPSRVFFMDATMRGIPTDVLHASVGSSARTRVRVASLLPIADAHGPEMIQAETVTVLNDLCVLAPAALVDAPIDWQTLGARRVRATFTNAGHIPTTHPDSPTSSSTSMTSPTSRHLLPRRRSAA